MTTRRRLLVFGLLATLIVLGVGGWLLWRHPGITRANAVRIQTGMTLDEVKATLGGPARKETTEIPFVDTAEREAMDRFNNFGDQPREPDVQQLYWHSSDVSICIRFKNGRVTEYVWLPMRPRQETWLDMLRRLLHL